MKKNIILLVVALLIAATGLFLYFRFRPAAQVYSVVTTQLQTGYIAKTVTATGEVVPLDSVSVGAQVSGVVKTVYVDFNSVVKKGQLLAKIDPTIAATQTASSVANLANARSSWDLQKSNYDRQNKLFKLGAISKSEYQISLNQYNSAKSQVDIANAQLKLSKNNLSYTDIYSPIDGVVLNRNVSAGQTIASSFNAPTLFVIAKDLTKMQVRADVDEADIGGVKKGQNVTFTVDAFPDDIFEGTVLDILLNPSKSANVVSYLTLINVDNRTLKLKPGMTASVNIYIEEDSSAQLLPSVALNIKPDSTLLKSYKIKRAPHAVASKTGMSQRGRPVSNAADSSAQKTAFVWILRGDTLTEREIVTGLNDDSFVKVLGGITPDESVVTAILAGDAKSTASGATRSPFLPQMQRKTPKTATTNKQ